MQEPRKNSSTMPQAPKIIFTDMDGTLLGANHHPIPGDEKILQRIAATGAKICFTSGRLPKGLTPFQKILGIQGPIISYSGALILDETGKTLFSTTFPLEKAHALLGEIEELSPGIFKGTYGYNTWVVTTKDNPFLKEEESYVLAQAVEDSNIDKYYSESGLHKILVMGEPHTIVALEEKIAPCHPELNVIRSSPIFLEFMSNDADKGNAVQRVLEHYQIDPADAVAFGDAPNDIAMLTVLERSYAMKNAFEEVKQAATFETEFTNEESGVVRELAKLFDL